MTWLKRKTYEKPKDLEKAIQSYFDSLEEGEYANPASLRLHIGLSKGNISNYRNSEKYAEYNDLMEAAYEVIESHAWKDLQTGKGSFGNFYLARCRKYSEKSEHEITGKDGAPLMPSITIDGKPFKLDLKEDENNTSRDS